MVPVAGQRTPPYQIRQLQQRGIPIVFCHRSVDDINAPKQLIPFYDIGRKAGEALIRQGHRRVAVFYYNIKKDGLPQPMVDGLRDSISVGGGQLPDEFCSSLPFGSTEIDKHEDEISSVLARICRRPDRPTAIMWQLRQYSRVFCFCSLADWGCEYLKTFPLWVLGASNAVDQYSDN